MRTLNWFEPGTPVSNDLISDTERTTGHSFPEDYQAFIRQNAGGAPEETDFEFPDGDETFHAGVGLFLTFYGEDGILTHSGGTEFFPVGLIPFAVDGGGNMVCFDYRSSETPTVAFWHHGRPEPRDVSHVSDTFTEFLQMLHLPDDEE